MGKFASAAARFAVILLIPLAGCRPAADPAEMPSEMGRRFLLEQEPSCVLSPAEAREQASSSRRVAVIGRIENGNESPWHEGQAAFVIADPAESAVDDAAHDHAGHDHENCPFCKARADARWLTIVQLVNREGRVLPVDVRRLLGLKQGQLVVVSGRPHVDSLGNLVIAAEGIFVRD